MNQKKSPLVFLGGDGRMAQARAVLARAGYDTADFPGEKMTRLILPLPAFDSAGNINGGPAFAQILPQIPPGTWVFGGKLDKYAEILQANDCRVTDYFLDEALTAENAAITAEGAIQLAMAALPITLRGSRALVIGWGRIGQLLAKDLRGLGCRVTATARKPKELAMIQALGYGADETGQYRQGLGGYRVIFNTIPAPALTAGQVSQTRPDCLLVELSSGGVMDNAIGRPFIQASGLPGKTAPETAGQLIGQTLLRLLQER